MFCTLSHAKGKGINMFSIITANWNGAKYLDSYLSSLVNQTYQDFNVYIVDNGSKDASFDILTKYEESLKLKLIKLNKNTGFAVANNIGIDEAMKDDSEYLITLNNDLELDPKCLENIHDNIVRTNGNYDIYQILMLNYFERNVIDAAGLKFDKYLNAYQIGYKKDKEILPSIPTEIKGACAGAAVYSKKALNKVKEKNGDYFDSRFFAYYEDVDLALRLLNAGFKSLLLKDALVYHIHSGTGIKGSYFKEYYLSRNDLIYRKKNLSVDQFNRYRPVFIFYGFKKMVRLLLQGNFSLIKGCIKGYQDYFKLSNSI